MFLRSHKPRSPPSAFAKGRSVSPVSVRQPTCSDPSPHRPSSFSRKKKVNALPVSSLATPVDAVCRHSDVMVPGPHVPLVGAPGYIPTAHMKTYLPTRHRVLFHQLLVLLSPRQVRTYLRVLQTMLVIQRRMEPSAYRQRTFDFPHRCPSKTSDHCCSPITKTRCSMPSPTYRWKT